MMNNIETARAAFEFFMRTANNYCESKMERDENGYKLSHVEAAWIGFEAGFKTASLAPGAAPSSVSNRGWHQVECACGDTFKADSYGAGFLDAKGRCFGCGAEEDAIAAPATASISNAGSERAAPVELPEPCAWMAFPGELSFSKPEEECVGLYDADTVSALLASIYEGKK